MRTRLLTVALIALTAPVALAGETVREFDWSELRQSGELKAGEVVPAPAGDPAAEELKIANPSGRSRTVPVLEVADPGVGRPAYALRGTVRGESIEGEAYLEMWSAFPGGKKFFSRTLGTRGPSRSLEGSFDRREFVLPFFVSESSEPPERLTLNLVLPGKGTVTLSRLRLVQYAPGEDPLKAAGAWWVSAPAD